MFINIVTLSAFVGPQHLVVPVQQSFMLLYLGPDSLMPLASILAAIIGIILMFWRRLLKPFKKTKASEDQPPESAVSDSMRAESNEDTLK